MEQNVAPKTNPHKYSQYYLTSKGNTIEKK